MLDVIGCDTICIMVHGKFAMSRSITTRSFASLRVAVLLGLVMAAFGVSAKTYLTNIPLIWKPTNLVSIGSIASLQRPLRIQVQPLVDTRLNPAAVGENREDADQGKLLPVTTRDSVAQWSTDRLRLLLLQGGYDLVDDGGDVVLSGEIRRFFVVETGTYQGEVELHLSLVDRDGHALWSGGGSNETSRFGRSYKAENYYEVLSDSFLGAVRNAVDQDSFRAALGHAP